MTVFRVVWLNRVIRPSLPSKDSVGAGPAPAPGWIVADPNPEGSRPVPGVGVTRGLSVSALTPPLLRIKRALIALLAVSVVETFSSFTVSPGPAAAKLVT